MNFMQGFGIGMIVGAVYCVYVFPWLQRKIGGNQWLIECDQDRSRNTRS